MPPPFDNLSAERRSRETRLGPTSLERDAHQRLRPLVAEHPSSIHPGVRLVIDASAPHRLSAGGYRARHEQVPAGSRGIAVDLDVAIQAVMDREGENARRSPEEIPDRVAPLEAAQAREGPGFAFAHLSGSHLTGSCPAFYWNAHHHRFGLQQLAVV
jgi:hypothetical protein